MPSLIRDDDEEEVPPPSSKEQEVIELLDDSDDERDTHPAADAATAVAAVTAISATTTRPPPEGMEYFVPDPLAPRRVSVANTTTLDQGRHQVTNHSDHPTTTTNKTNPSASEPLHVEQVATEQAPGVQESGVSQELEQTDASIPIEGSSTVKAVNNIYSVHPKVSPDVFSSGETNRSIRTNTVQPLHDHFSKNTFDTPYDVDSSLADEEELLLATIESDIGASTITGEPNNTEPSAFTAETQAQDNSTAAAAPVNDSYSEKLKRGASWNERVSKALFFNTSDGEDDDDEIMDDPMDFQDTPVECHEIPPLEPVTDAGEHRLQRERIHVSQSGSSTPLVAAIYQPENSENSGHVSQSGSSTPLVAAVHQPENYGHASQSGSCTPLVAAVHQTENSEKYAHASQSGSSTLRVVTAGLTENDGHVSHSGSSSLAPRYVAVHQVEKYGHAMQSNAPNSQDLSPIFPKATLDFLFSAGIKSVRELSSMDKHDLASKLLDSPGFKIGCALGAWKFDKTLNDIEMTRIAYNTVGVWKTELISWLGWNGRTAEASLQTHFEKLQERKRKTETPSLSSFLTKSDCNFLKGHCNIRTAEELVRSDHNVIISNLKRALLAKLAFPQNLKDGFVEGLVTSWVLRAREGLGPRETGSSGRQNEHPRRNNAAEQVETNTVDLCEPRASPATAHNGHSNTAAAAAAAAASRQFSLNNTPPSQTQHLPAPHNRNHIPGANIGHNSNALVSQTERQNTAFAEDYMRKLEAHIKRQWAQLKRQQKDQQNTMMANFRVAPHQKYKNMAISLQQKHEAQDKEWIRLAEEERRKAKSKLEKFGATNILKAKKRTSNLQRQQHQQQVDVSHNPQPSSQCTHASLPSQDQQSHQIVMIQDRHSGSRAHQNGSTSAWTPPITKQNERKAPAKEISSVSPSKENKFLCPLSYYTLLFLRFYGVHCDSELEKVDTALLAKFYLEVWDESIKTIAAAERLVKDWKAKARKARGQETNADDFIPIQKSLKGHTDANDPPLMDSVHHLCHTTVDPQTGFPRRVITAYDVTNDVMYDFVVNVKESNITGAGHGAFITFKGARELKRRKVLDCKQRSSSTRESLEASFGSKTSGVTVAVNGERIHGDEHDEEVDNGVGERRQYSAERDFSPVRDNVTFCSHDKGSGLISLGRYAPFQPEDRKIDVVYEMKNFIFSLEPSSWGFSVEERIHDHEQTVDITDDGTGEPHEIARQNIPMYVNEAGHGSELHENVVARHDVRTVFYYLYVKAPMHVGDTVELLVDYGDTYEDVRERKGYGRANKNGEGQSDSDDFARLQRNFTERSNREENIRNYSLDEIRSILYFIRTRVLTAAHGRNETVIARQWVARRRLHWFASRLNKQLLSLACSLHDQLSHEKMGDKTDNIEGDEPLFTVGMLAFVNEWVAANDTRPPYTGVATVESTRLNKRGRRTYDICTEGTKTILDVPEEVLTHVSEEDIQEVPTRKMKRHQMAIEVRQLPSEMMLFERTLRMMAWDNEENFATATVRSMITSICEDRSTSAEKLVIDALKKDVAEELLYDLHCSGKLERPYDLNNWCSLSLKIKKSIVDMLSSFSLQNNIESISELKILSEGVLRLAREASSAMKRITKEATSWKETKDTTINSWNESSLRGLIHPLCFWRRQEEVWMCLIPDSHISGNESYSRSMCTLKDILKEGYILDIKWYIAQQVIALVDTLVSTIKWSSHSDPSLGGIYSLQKLCSVLNMDESEALLLLSNK